MSGNSTSAAGSNAAAAKNFANTPPQKIIRALYDYDTQGPGELRFRKGDFLYVTGYNSTEEWYEAYDPPSNMRGMVPVTYFEVVSKKGSPSPATPGGASTAGSFSSDHADLSATPSALSNGSKNSASNRSLKARSGQTQLYGIVLYDFIAERSDELQAKAGESIIIIATSNEEWFVAKPIGRLGGPGLIPVSFIEVRDIGSNKPVDNLEEAIRKANVPRVEEWKQQAAEYKASSIPLGKFEDSSNTTRNGLTDQLKNMHLNNSYEQQQHHQQPQQLQQQPQQPPPQQLPAQPQRQHSQQFQQPLAKQRAMPDSSKDRDVYVIKASVERYAYDNDRYWYLVVATLSNGRFRNLCRYYQDFYDFQITLLEEFPDEAGRTGNPRTLPFMPGPLTYVNDSISSQRRANLDDYVRKLTLMPDYISRSPTVQKLFAIRVGDIETSEPATVLPHPPDRTTTVSGTSAVPNTTSSSAQPSQVSLDRTTSMESGLRMQQQQQLHQQQQQHQSFSQAPTPESPKSLQSKKSQAQSEDATMHTQYEDLDHTAMSRKPSADALSPSQESHTGSGTRASTPTTPSAPTGAAGEAWVKIKVFHQDDLIAMRVLNSIPFETLRAKIADRLGGGASAGAGTLALLYKDEATGQLSELRNADDFAAVLSGKEKLVLCAK